MGPWLPGLIGSRACLVLFVLDKCIFLNKPGSLRHDRRIRQPCLFHNMLRLQGLLADIAGSEEFSAVHQLTCL